MGHAANHPRCTAAWLLAFMLAAAPTWGEPPPARVTPRELAERLSASPRSFLLLDVRTAAEFAAGHLPGAVNVPHDQLPTRLAELAASRAQEIVVYCRTGRRTRLALQILRAGGFERLLHLEGDYLAWESSGRRIESAATRADAQPAAPAQPQ
jgi:rhodanese-related sulfurtransferase